jgi:hypothetical protein
MVSITVPVAGAAMPTSASTAKEDEEVTVTEKLCGKDNPTNLYETCTAIAGHRGRHMYRGTRTKEEVDALDMKEMVVTVTGEEVAVVETTEGPVEAPVEAPVIPEAWAPDRDDFVSLKGKAYLPARRRIQWMRGLPVGHPDWTIDTEIIEHVIGKLTKPGPVGVGRVEGGYAVVRANVYDTDGRLIATGLKSEYSENFTDYLEKAETGAIARALAVAGYGTESALDLDEGVEAGRIADAPVEVPARAVKLGPSAVKGVGRGGKTDGASVLQIRRVAELSRELELTPEQLTHMIASLLGEGPALGTDEAFNSSAIATFLSERSGDEVGSLVLTLEAGLPAKK